MTLHRLPVTSIVGFRRFHKRMTDRVRLEFSRSGPTYATAVVT